MRRPAVRSICVALTVVIASRSASAHVGAPTWGGQLAGEPAGIHDIAILREDLAAAVVSLGALVVLAVGAWLAQAAGRRAHAASSGRPRSPAKRESSGRGPV